MAKKKEKSKEKVLEEKIEKLIYMFESHQRKMKKIENSIQNAIMAQNKKLNMLQEQMEITEGTNTNILLAIRQNEYLQAWYPAQSGFKEMNVVGEHPLVTKRRAEKKR